MSGITTQLPLSAVTNPILLWLFQHGWEDPSWGHLPINQAALGLVLHNISEKLADRNIQEQVQVIARKVVAENSQHAVR